ncbi:MAG: hypothetical protein ACJAS1_004790 [Oleiphilaceae bacterium]
MVVFNTVNNSFYYFFKTFILSIYNLHTRQGKVTGIIPTQPKMLQYLMNNNVVNQILRRVTQPRLKTKVNQVIRRFLIIVMNKFLKDTITIVYRN